MEHSLVSVSKWEAIWTRPFLKAKVNFSPAEILSYLECMTITQNVRPMSYQYIYLHKLHEVYEYIEAPMTATTFHKKEGGGRAIITSEIIYYWMIFYGIPFECKTWHLNRLLTLIKVCDLKNQPSKKNVTTKDLRDRHYLNQQRLKQLNTRG